MSFVPLEEAAFSELIQHPTETTGKLARARAVKLHRRGADDLVLMSADRAEQEGEVIDLTARLLAGVLRREGGPGIVRDVLPTVLPWVRFLPPAAVEELSAEFIAVAEAAAGVGNTAPISHLLAEWRHTAEVYADPELHTMLTREHEGDHGAVPMP